MTNAPQRIHVTASHDGDTGSWNKNRIDERFGLTQTEFVRADVAQAMVAAAYEVAAFECEGSNLGLTAEDVADDIRAHTPADARAALDAMVAKAREDALREAASFSWLCFHKCDVEVDVVTTADILALIPTVKDAR